MTLLGDFSSQVCEFLHCTQLQSINSDVQIDGVSADSLRLCFAYVDFDPKVRAAVMDTIYQYLDFFC